MILGRFLFALAISASATSFMPRPFETTVNEAPQIVRGKIQGQDVKWSEVRGSKRLFTYFDLRLDEVIKGRAQASASGMIAIRSPGGEKDGVGLSVSGAPEFEKGEEVVVFLSDPNADGSFDIEGLMMGKLNVIKDENGDEQLVGPATQFESGVMIHGHEGGHGAHESQDHDGDRARAPKAKWTLVGLRDLVEKTRKNTPSSLASSKSQEIQPTTGSQESGKNPTPQASALQPLDQQEMPILPEKESPVRWDYIGFFAIALVGAAFFLRMRRR